MSLRGRHIRIGTKGWGWEVGFQFVSTLAGDLKATSDWFCGREKGRHVVIAGVIDHKERYRKLNGASNRLIEGEARKGNTSSKTKHAYDEDKPGTVEDRRKLVKEGSKCLDQSIGRHSNHTNVRRT